MTEGHEQDEWGLGEYGSPGEERLRRLLRESVVEIEPAPGALERLRDAVPVRRARRRQLIAGAAAAVLAGGAAVPAVINSDMMSGSDRPLHAAGHSESQEPGDQREPGDDGGHTTGQDHSGEKTGGGDDSGANSSAPSDGGPSARPSPSSLEAVAPTCTQKQLGEGTARLREPDPEGNVYGTFRVVNTSETVCAVTGDGHVVASARGRAKSEAITVLDHTASDPATNLPDPAEESEKVLLEPGAAYAVRFAWMPRPSDGPGCSSSGATSPTADGGATGTPGTAGGGSTGKAGTPDEGGDTGGDGGTGDGGASGGMDGGAGDDGGGKPEASVVISHSLDIGASPVAEAVLRGACAGTLYRTGVLPAA